MFLLKYYFNENIIASLSCFHFLPPNPPKFLLPKPSHHSLCFLAAKITPEKITISIDMLNQNGDNMFLTICLYNFVRTFWLLLLV